MAKTGSVLRRVASQAGRVLTWSGRLVDFDRLLQQTVAGVHWKGVER